jgi:hypothetical protein
MCRAPGSLDAQLQRRWLLGLMRVLHTDKGLKLGQHLSTKLILWQHSAGNGFPKDLVRMLLEMLFGRLGSQTRVACLPRVRLLLPLFAREHYLFGIDHDHKVAYADVRGVCWAMLTHQDGRDITGQPANDFAIGIYQMPVLFHFAWLSHVCLRGRQFLILRPFRHTRMCTLYALVHL